MPGNTTRLHHVDHHDQVGVDPVMRRRIWEHLEQLSTNQQPDSLPTTIIITTHYIEEARGADRYICILFIHFNCPATGCIEWT